MRLITLALFPAPALARGCAAAAGGSIYKGSTCCYTGIPLLASERLFQIQNKTSSPLDRLGIAANVAATVSEAFFKGGFEVAYGTFYSSQRCASISSRR